MCSFHREVREDEKVMKEITICLFYLDTMTVILLSLLMKIWAYISGNYYKIKKELIIIID